MAISFSFIVERSDELETALGVIVSDPAYSSGAFFASSHEHSKRVRDDVTAEVGFRAPGAVQMRIVNSRSVEATDGLIRGSLAAARRLSGASALYVELDSRIFRRTAGALECYPASGYWSLERLAWVQQDHPVLILSDANYPSEAHRAYELTESSGHWYVIERLDGTEVVRVLDLKVAGRTLALTYELRNTRMSGPTAQVLIMDKVLHGLLEDRYRSEVDQIAFLSATAEVTRLPYV
ncbi:MAG: hypothetical protein ABI548_22440 [Polyangiaceae bacterium]